MGDPNLGQTVVNREKSMSDLANVCHECHGAVLNDWVLFGGNIDTVVS